MFHICFQEASMNIDSEEKRNKYRVDENDTDQK